MSKLTKRTVSIRCEENVEGWTDVPGICLDNLALTPAEWDEYCGVWNITHIKSGRAIIDNIIESKQTVIAVMRELDPLFADVPAYRYGPEFKEFEYRMYPLLSRWARTLERE